MNKEKVKLRGVSALMEDREKLFTESEVRSAIKAAVFESRKKLLFSINDMDLISDSAIAALKKGLPIIPKTALKV